MSILYTAPKTFGYILNGKYYPIHASNLARASDSHGNEIPIILADDSKLKVEKKLETVGKSGIQHSSVNSEAMYQCYICKRFGKLMFFANKEDLQLHVQGLHIGYPTSEAKRTP